MHIVRLIDQEAVVKSSTVEEYLESIYKLQRTEHPVRPSALAGHMGVSAASVVEMIKKLADESLLYRSENSGICLTEEGERQALRLIRKHRLAERFLTDILGISWDRAHEEACKFEHVMAEEVEDGLDRLLDSPATCPHGHPIPSKEGTVKESDSVPLCELGAGEKGVIVLVSEEEPKMLRYLATLGLMPDAVVEVEQVAPFNGPLLVQVGGPKYALGREVAEKILVREA